MEGARRLGAVIEPQTQFKPSIIKITASTNVSPARQENYKLKNQRF